MKVHKSPIAVSGGQLIKSIKSAKGSMPTEITIVGQITRLERELASVLPKNDITKEDVEEEKVPQRIQALRIVGGEMLNGEVEDEGSLEFEREKLPSRGSPPR